MSDAMSDMIDDVQQHEFNKTVGTSEISSGLEETSESARGRLAGTKNAEFQL